MRHCFLQRLRRALVREDGVALVFALGISVALAGTVATAVTYTTRNSQTASRAKADQLALALAEAGLNNAYATLYAASNPSMASAVPRTSQPLEGGTAVWFGTLDGQVWTLTGEGHVPNPTGGAEIVRTVTGRVRIGSSRRGTANNAVWNYVYSDDPSGCMDLGNSVTVNVPLYVRGNLCMSNSARFTGYSLQVGGTLSLSNSAQVGSSDPNASSSDPGNPQVHEVHVGGGCRLGTSGPFASPCGAAQRVYSELPPDSTTGNLAKPPVDLATWYRDSKPGPMHACTSGSFPGGFDNDTVMNRSRGDVDLTPGSAYDCTVRDGGGSVLGRLAWDPATKRLTIAGTIFFDGNIVFRTLNEAYYEGRATIYSSGTITLRNSTTLCGSTSCGADWNPSQNLLAFVAGSSTDATGISIENSSRFQGALYAVNDYSEGNSAVVWGPIIARQVYLQNSTQNHYVPIGTLLPGMPASYEDVVTLTNEPGSWGA